MGNVISKSFGRFRRSFSARKVNCITLSFVPMDSYHPALHIELDLMRESLGKFMSLRGEVKFNFRKANYPLLYEMLLEVDWWPLAAIVNADAAIVDTDAALDYFYSLIYSGFGKYVSHSGSSVVAKGNPVWYTTEITTHFRLKSKARKNFRRTQK